MSPHLTTEDAARFWSKVDTSGECWIWTGSFTPAGYGQFYAAGKTHSAHRVAWELVNGLIGDSRIFVCHNCPGGDNPACVRPGHMFLGTNKDNMQDASRKGTIAKGARHGSVTHPERLLRGDENPMRRRPEIRLLGDKHWTHKKPERVARGLRNGAYTRPEKVNKGEQNGAAKLTWPQVREIRSRYAAGGTSYVRLGREYGVDQSTIFLIVKHKKWQE